ncbi:MAG: histidine phosphatase family protein [Rickettsiaceae bacterium]
MRLLLMRHANTEVAENKKDFERVLTEQGKQEAIQAAKFLHQYQIDKIIVSYVKRTMQTASIIQEQVPAAELQMVTELYEGSQEDIINLLTNQDDRSKHILVIGHNPLIYTTILELVETDTKEYDVLVQSSMPTARIVIIDFPEISDWHEITSKKGKITKIFTPDTAH